jgi:hypothetical protein
LFKQSIFATIAILSIAASATADAKPRHNKQRAVQATIVCDDRGCSDHRLTVRDTARVGQTTVRTKVRFAHRNRATGIKHAGIEGKVRNELRNEVRQVRVSRQSADAGIIVCNQQGCSDRQMAPRAESAAAPAAVIRRTARMADANGNDATVLGGRPAGCPHAFCGCEASRYVFGEMRPELYLAANWIRKFPRTMPAPGMAAARSGHVMILISHVGGNDWLVHDGNSGGGLTRQHVRSISGHVIVDPQGLRQAQRH